MQFTAQQISDLIDGTIEGDAEVAVSEISKIEEAKSGSITFLSNPKYESYLYSSEASIVIINEDQQVKRPVQSTLIRVKDAYTALSVLLEIYNQLRFDKKGIEEGSFIHPTATIGKDVYIAALSYIGPHAKIGDYCKIYPHSYIGDHAILGSYCTIHAGVKIYYDCVLGDRVMVHSGAVIGSDGFGFAPQINGSYKKINQIGNVVIGNDVEVGANTTIDRATLGSTKIGNGVKLDNLIQLAHNVELGENTVIAAQTGVSGSAKVAENVVLGGQVGVAGHITIAKGSQVQAQSGINRSIVESNKKWAGTPASNYASQMRIQVTLQKLPLIEKRIAELENLINKK